MLEQNEPVSPSPKKKSPVNPAVAAGILACLTFFVFTLNTRASASLPATPLLAVLAVFCAGSFGYTVLIKPVYALASAVFSVAIIVAAGLLMKMQIGLAAILASPAILAFLSGGGIGLAAKRKGSMTLTVIAGAALPASVLIGAVMIHSYVATGSPTETMRLLIEELRSETLTIMKEYSEQMLRELKLDPAQLDLEGVINNTFNILPGTLAASSVVLSYFAHKTMLFTARAFGLPSDIPEETRRFEMSLASAIVYTAAFTVWLFSGSGIVNVSANNIAVCLVPGLALSGAKGAFAEKKNGIVRIGCMPILIFIFLLSLNPALALMILALLGALGIIGNEIKALRERKKD